MKTSEIVTPEKTQNIPENDSTSLQRALSESIFSNSAKKQHRSRLSENRYTVTSDSCLNEQTSETQSKAVLLNYNGNRLP